MFRLEPRPQPSAAMVLGSPLLAVLATLVCAALMFALQGKDVARGLALFFAEPLASADGWSELGVKAAPLLLIAHGLAVCFRAGVWNIGAEGQYVLGAICGGGVAMQANEASSRGVVLWILLAGALGGAAWAAIVALLRDRFHASEIVVSLMLVYVAELLLGYLVSGPWKDPQGFNFPHTINFAAPAQVPRLIGGLRVHMGAPIALGAGVLIWLLLFRSYAGFALQVGGLAPLAARYAGFSAPRALWTSLLVSGALAGLAGALEAAGPLGQLTPYVPSGYGFAAIIVAFVGRLHPLGITFSAVLMSMLYIGGELAQSRLGLPKVTGVLQGILLFALLACDTLIHQRVRWRRAATRPGPEGTR